MLLIIYSLAYLLVYVYLHEYHSLNSKIDKTEITLITVSSLPLKNLSVFHNYLRTETDEIMVAIDTIEVPAVVLHKASMYLCVSRCVSMSHAGR